MPFQKKNSLFESRRVVDLPVDKLSPNPNQPRALFQPEALEELAQSIAVHGVLQPLSVRRTEDGTYQLISGERRLRAARMAGLDKVPCILIAAGEEESALLALVENLQRRDLDFLEEALALSQLISTYRLTQEEAARKIGKSQSAVANKLRLLRLDPDALTLLRSKGFTERHARALLRLPTDELQRAAARRVVDRDMTVRAAEEYVERLLADKSPRKEPRFILRDVRLFLNTLTKGVDLMRSAGVPADFRRQDTDREILLTIRIPR